MTFHPTKCPPPPDPCRWKMSWTPPTISSSASNDTSTQLAKSAMEKLKEEAANRFVAGGTVDKPNQRDAEWMAAEQALEDERSRKAKLGKEHDGKSLYEVLQENKGRFCPEVPGLIADSEQRRNKPHLKRYRTTVCRVEWSY
jgi:hypothetical protein